MSCCGSAHTQENGGEDVSFNERGNLQGEGSSLIRIIIKKNGKKK
jgi:hypothetical protein